MRQPKLTISLLDFIKTGRFGKVAVGMTKQEIRGIFPKPDQRYSALGEIWRYSTFEFLFSDDELMVLWCDWLDQLKNPRKKQLKLDRSFISYRDNSFDAVARRLLKEELAFTTAATYYSKQEMPDSIILFPNCNQTVELYFEAGDRLATSPSAYNLIAIGSCASRIRVDGSSVRWLELP